MDLKRLDDARLLSNMLCDFPQRYLQWLDELERVVTKLRTGETSQREAVQAIMRWNVVNSALKNNINALQYAVPESMATSVYEYHHVASRLFEALEEARTSGPNAARWTELVESQGLRTDLENAFARFLDIYGEFISGRQVPS